MGEKSANRRGRGMSRKEGFEFFGLNGSAWSTARNFMENFCGEKPSVVFGQEHRLDNLWLGEVACSMRGAGWALAITPSASGAKGGRSAGTFIAVPKALGITYLEGRESWDVSPPGSPGRVCAGWSPVLVKGGVVLVSAYLWDGEELSIRNLSVLESLGELLVGNGLPWILQLDAQNTPEALIDTGWVDDVRGKVFRCGKSTCSGRGGGREIDFFIVSDTLAHAFCDAELVEAGTSPHSPVKMVSKGGARKPTAWKFVKPKKFETERPIGCAPPPPTWPQKPATEGKLDDEVLGNWWKEISKAAEQEVCGILGLVGEEKEEHVGRGSQPKTRKMPLAGPICRGEVRGNAASEAWRWLAARAGEAARLNQLVGEHKAPGETRRRIRGKTKVGATEVGTAGQKAKAQKLREDLREARARLIRGLHRLAPTGEDSGATQRTIRQGLENGWPNRTEAAFLEILAGAAASRAKTLEGQAKNKRQKEWRAKLVEGSKKGAGYIHRLSKWKEAPAQTGPTKSQAERGLSRLDLLDPQRCVDEEGQKWDQLWASHGEISKGLLERPWEAAVYLSPLVDISPEKFRAICRTFKGETGLGTDWWNPKNWAWLSDEGVLALLGLVLYISQFQHWPPQTRLILYFLLLKKEGGFRPIGLLPSLVRVAERCHADVLVEWERESRRPYDWAAAGGGAEDAMWDQMLADEAVEENQCSATAVLDLEKAFEHVTAYGLWKYGPELGVKRQMLSFMISIFSMQRVVAFDGVVATVRSETFSAAVAGSVGGTRALKIMVLGVLDLVVRRWPLVDARLYVDDLSLQRVGGREEVAREIGEATTFYIKSLEDRGIPVSRRRTPEDPPGKGTIIATDALLRDKLAPVAKKQGLTFSLLSAQLGVDNAGGKRVVRNKQRSRLNTALRRKVKLTILKRKGADARAVALRGLQPSLAYGASCLGVGPGMLEKTRVITSTALQGNAAGKDRTLRLWLDEVDPLVCFSNLALVKWARAVWEGAAPKTRMHRAWKNAAIQDAKANKGGLWRSIRGPAGATRASLARIGWKWPSPTVFIDAAGEIVDLTKVAPLTVRAMVAKQVEDNELRAWAKKAELQGITKPFLEPIRAEIRKAPPQGKAAIKAFVCEGFWTQQKIWERGFSETCLCQACLEKPGTQRHRVFQCPHFREVREAICAKSGWNTSVVHRGEADSQNSPLWNRCLVDHPLKQDDLVKEQWAWEGGMPPEEPFTGNCYTDGSRIGHRMLGAFGWGFVMVSEAGEKIAGAFGALPGRRCFGSVLRAELFALLMLLRHALPPIRIGIDNSTVVKGLTRGAVWSTSWKRPHADIWKSIWGILEDAFVDEQGLVVAKVKAHRGKKVGETLVGLDKVDFLGNGFADDLAKQGAKLSEPQPWELLNLEEKWSDARRAAHFVSTFHLEAGELKDTTGRVIAARDRNGARLRRAPAKPHTIVVGADGLRCKICGKCAKTQKGRKRFARAVCAGAPTGVRRRINGKRPGFAVYEGSRGLGHDLWRQERLDITWCHTCGGYAAQRAHLLAQHCRGTAVGGCKLRRDRLARGRDPTNPKRQVGISKRLTGTQARAFLVKIQEHMDR